MSDQTSSGLPTSITQPGTQPITLNHQTIIWLVIVSVIVAATFITVVWLLCRCSCTKGRRRRSLRTRRLSTAVLDDRNDFHHWNKNVPAPGQAYGHGSEDVQLTPLTRAAVRPSGAEEMHPGQPVVVDEAAAEPSLASRPRNGSRYYSGWRESTWRRLSRGSQIGRAY